MIGYVTVGADDLALAEQFYSAFLPRLGYGLDISHEGLSYSIPAAVGQPWEPPDFYVKPPFDGQAASAGNGTMVAFSVPTQTMVRELHAAALAAGGRTRGLPAFAPNTARTSMWAICAIPRATRSRFTATAETSPGGRTDRSEMH